MTDTSNKSKTDEDDFAKRLEKEHEQLIAVETDELGSAAENRDDEERVQSALAVLQLLEQIKSVPAKPQPANVPLETQNDPSTKKQDHPSNHGAKPPITEYSIPNLRRLGRFEILEQIGRGGFGIVVRARDPQLGRNVAIKIPRFESALSSQSRQRFERESKSAAALNHPGIVSVFETGTDQGISFIVTELIDGENLATYLARGNSYSPKKSVQLVARLADALEHAHQRNVLHRDIKPSNILLPSDQTEDPKPLIADFGLAAITDQHDLTQTGAVVGTPAYMSPEQSTGAKDQLCPATDVYGLGTILYELLTGQPPFAELPIIEMLEAINRRDPEPPRTMEPSIPRDIESICLKCLEKKPRQRYLTAQDLQADLQRFINDTPVLARRINSWDRSIRWVRRNPALATVGSLSMIFLLAALIASVWGWTSTSTALERENQAKNDARQTVNQYFTDVAENDLLEVPGLLPLRQKLLERALGYYQNYLNDSSADTEVVEELELAHFRVGKIQSELGNFPEAIQALESAIVLQRKQLANDDADLELLSRNLETLRQIGQAQNELGNYEAGLAALDLAIDGQRELVASDPVEADWKYQLSRTLHAKANALGEKGEFQNANKLGNEVVELLTELAAQDVEDKSYLRDLAGTYLDQANAIAKTGSIDEAVVSIDLAIQIFRDMIDSGDPTAKDFFSLATALHNRAGKNLAKREPGPALPLLEEASELNSHLVRMFPNAVEYRRQKLALMNGLGYCYSVLKQTDKVIEVLGSSIETHKHLMNKSPDNPKVIYKLAVDQMNLGSTLAQQTDHQNEAKNLLLEAEDNLAAFLKTTPDFFQAKMAFAFCKLNLAAIENQLNNHVSALEYADQSIEMLEMINAGKPNVPQVIQNLGGAYHNRADALDYLKRWEETVPAWKLAVEQGGPLKVRSELRLAEALARTGRVTESILILEALEKEPSTRDRHAGDLGRAQASIANAISESENADEEQIESLLNRSVASIELWIQTSQNLKMSSLEKMRNLDAFELLRQRDDFNELLESATNSIRSRQ